MAVSSSQLFKGSISEASTSTPGSMRSPLSSFTVPSPVSSRLTMEFETAFLVEAEEPVRFSTTDDILPYLSQPSSSCSASSSDFDTQSGTSRSTSFCDFNDSNRITLGTLIALPMDSFRHFGESFRGFLLRGDSHDFDSSSSTASHASPRRSRTCSLLGDLFGCLPRTRTDFVPAAAPARRNLANLTSFTITEASEQEERDSDCDPGPTIFDNSVFVDRETLGSRIYEFNPLYIADVMSEVDPSESRNSSFSRDHHSAAASGETHTSENTEVKNAADSGAVETPRSPLCRSQPLSPMRTVLTTVCCQLGDDSDEYLSE